MLDRLSAMEKRYEELNELLASPEVLDDRQQWQGLIREQRTLQDTVSRYRQLKAADRELQQVRALAQEEKDPEMLAMAQQEQADLQLRRDALFDGLKQEFAAKAADPDRERNCIMEIRAGTGGEEAALFAGDLYRMYAHYAQTKGWEVEVMDSSESERGGFKEIVFAVKGQEVYRMLRNEGGVHRVQRVPATEASGRIHTSTATVTVLPEAEEVEVDINPEELRVDIYHSSGAGGQNVNKVATAVRITHLPSGMVVACQDDRSQLRNRMKAMRVLRARLLDIQKRKQQEEVSRDRRSQVGGAERAEKIRTYNYPQGRVTDHRIGLTIHNLPAVMEGGLDRLVEALVAQEEADKIASEA